MKKFITFLMVTVFAFAVATAQDTVITKPAAFDNTYVGLTVGADCPTNGLVKNLYPEANLYVGHNFTPVWGVELDGQMGMHRSFKSEPTFVAGSYVGVAGTLNLNNLIAGYRGKARGVEVVPFVGLGWYHTYGVVSNSIATKMGVDVRFGLTADRAWQLNVRPTIAYDLTGNGPAKYDINYSRTGLEVGVTYHFKNHDGNHNFTQKKVVDYADWVALNDEVNTLRALPTNVYSEVVTVTDTVVVRETVNTLPVTNVGFNLNSAEINYTQLAGVQAVAKAMNLNPALTAEIRGYADAMTGTPEYNMNLSERRAEAVKDVLVSMGVDASRVKTFAEGSCTQIYTKNDWNRAAVITLK